MADGAEVAAVTRLRPLLAAFVVTLPLLALGRGMATPPIWTASFQSAQCVGPVCVITKPFVEVSWGEYSHP